ncbi:MAG: hypothetical protein ABIS06_20080 [Vicinamibacterales bacterium]
MKWLRDGVLLRTLLAMVAALLFVASAVAITGDISFRVGPLPVRAHNASGPSAAAFLILAIAWIAARADLRKALTWWWALIERRAALLAVALATLALMVGINWGTFAAGGSDSYCYLNQAELFARGQVRDVEPLATDPAWPGSTDAFVPVGHNPSPVVAGSFVPMCPAGYPLLLALTSIAAGRTAMFWVTPVFGALCVWFAFVLGGRTGGPAAGILAATLTLTSPIFLYQVVQPMNDVVAAALWGAALACATWPAASDFRRAVLGGLITGAAITVRPNLVPLAGAMGLCVMILAGTRSAVTLRARIVALLAFSASVLPGLIIVMAVQSAMYGSPFRSGYGDLGLLFSWSHVVPNIVQYARWTAGAHTVVIALALLGPVVLEEKRREAICLLLFAFATLACYLPYVVFDAWWYQRFLLPGIVPVLILTSAGLMSVLTRLEPASRLVGFVLVLCSLPLFYVHTAVERDVFRLKGFEARFRTTGQYAARLPAESVFITASESGSVRFYSSRPTAVWLGIEPGGLTAALDFLRSKGRKPYLLIESGEERAFRERFATEKLGSLEWPPVAEIDRTVKIYDPADYERYLRGEFIKSERVLTSRIR